jgi:pimeloyl-ACP methyl ester carboxylesterase
MRSALLLALCVAFFGCSAGAEQEESTEAAVASPELALSNALAEHCSGSEIHRIERQAPDGRHFSYGYRFKAPTGRDAPVLVFLPGGPGAGSMDAPPDFLPEGWGYLLTDPRGVGCNTLAETPSGAASSAFFTTKNVADDVIAAIRDRKLDTYVLFGVSYGTALGTTVIHTIEKANDPKPRAVVLEGVLGRAFGKDFVGGEYLEQWDRVRRSLPADVLTELETRPKPFGLDSLQWSRALMELLPVSPTFVASNLGALSQQRSDVTPETRKEIVALFRESGSAPPLTAPGEVELYRQIACREIMDTVPASDLDVVFSKGNLVRNSAEEGTKCAGLKVETPYDSAKLQFKTPVYYFIGQDDVATPAFQGEYHFAKHEGPATKIVSTGAGHNSLELNQEPCARAVMTSIGGGGTDLDAVLATCPLRVEVARK